MNIAIIGASGFIGSELTRQLLDSTDHALTLFSHKASLLTFSDVDEKRIKHVNGSVLNKAEITDALKGCDIAVYLVHLMGNDKHFIEDEKVAAYNFAEAVNVRHLKRVVYVGGMASEDENLTNHLSSRSLTGKIFRNEIQHVIELRTPMVVGRGGAGFEVLRQLVHTSPLLPVPSWANGVTNPITCADVARYVIRSLDIALPEPQLSIAVGGPEALSYAQIARRYATWRQKRLHIVPLPLLPQRLAVRCLRLLKNHPHAITVADMLGSAGYSPRADVEKAAELFGVHPEPIEMAFY